GRGHGGATYQGEGWTLLTPRAREESIHATATHLHLSGSELARYCFSRNTIDNRIEHCITIYADWMHRGVPGHDQVVFGHLAGQRRYFIGEYCRRPQGRWLASPDPRTRTPDARWRPVPPGRRGQPALPAGGLRRRWRRRDRWQQRRRDRRLYR